MVAIDNLNGKEALADLVRRVRRLENGTPMNNSSIGRGGLRIYGGGGITIENGGLSVTGSAVISGLLEATGTINMSGVVNMTGTFTATGTVRLSGPTDIWGPLTVTGDTDLDGITTISGNTSVTGDFTVTGPTDLNGETTIAGDTTVTGDFNVDGPMKTTGTLSVEGITTLKNDLNVTTGKVVAGGVTVDPGFLSGSVRFSNGTYLAASPNGAQLSNPFGGVVTVGNNQADMTGGGHSFIVNDVGFYLNGSLPETTEPANLYISPGGRLYKSTA